MTDPLCSVLLQHGRLELKDRSIGYFQHSPARVLPWHYHGVQSWGSGSWHISQYDAYGRFVDMREFPTTEQAFSYCITQYRHSEAQAVCLDSNGKPLERKVCLWKQR